MDDYRISADEIARFTGLEMLQSWLDGTRPMPPMALTMNYRFEHVSDGKVTLRATPLPGHCNPNGVTHGGWFGTVMDTATACSVQSRLPKGRSYTTLEYKLNTLRPLPPGTEVFVTGICVHAGRSTGAATGEIRDAEGKLYATGSQTVLMLDL